MERFSLGLTEISPAAAEALATAQVDPAIFFSRHQQGEWGNVDDNQRQGNEIAVQQGGIISSKYRLADQVELLLSTAADRSYTRLMLSTEFQRREVSAQEGYDIWAASYSQEKNPLIAVEEPVVDELLAALTPASALDAGAGTGRHALKLARRGIKVTAFDQSPGMLAVAEQRAQAEGLTLDLRPGSLADPLPFEANQFDLVICALALCHISNLAGVVDEFFRVMQPGGYLLISDLHPNFAMYESITVARPEAIYVLPNAGHSQSAYLRALEQAGFTLLKLIEVPIRNIPEGYLPAIRETLIRNQGDKPLCLVLLAQK
jgi:ubiquinone/menaquinone biosynthesis C-methylase UbiE